jgi:phage minor structural protein
MYQILCDGNILHDTRLDGLQVINAKCNLELNKTGYLSFSIPPTHQYYDVIQKHTSEITLLQDNEIIFVGRVLNDDIDFDNIKNIECEGELSYLLDSIQRYHEYHLDGGSENVIKTYLNTLITNHNSQVQDARKKFTLGDVTITDPNNYLYKVSNYEDTLTTITDKLIGTYGGYLVIRHSGNTKYLDYVKEYTGVCGQTIEFGKNIIDMNRYIKGEDIFTALIPLGATDDTTEKRIDITSLSNSTSGTIVKKDDYIYDTAGVKKWGWIWKTYNWNDVTEPQNLLSKAKQLLSYGIAETFTIELTAIDLHLLDIDIDRIKLGNKIRCVSVPHGIDAVMLVENILIDIDNPENTKIELMLPDGQIVTGSSKKPSITNNQVSSDKTVNDFNKVLDESYVNKGSLDTTVDDLKDWVDDNYCAIDGSNIDLSEYARIDEVNSAFDSLANALLGV